MVVSDPQREPAAIAKLRMIAATMARRLVAPAAALECVVSEGWLKIVEVVMAAASLRVICDVVREARRVPRTALSQSLHKFTNGSVMPDAWGRTHVFVQMGAYDAGMGGGLASVPALHQIASDRGVTLFRLAPER